MVITDAEIQVIFDWADKNKLNGKRVATTKYEWGTDVDSKSFENIAKLRRDVLLHHSTQAILVYPKITFKERDFTLSVYDFKFKIEEKAMPC